MQISIQTNFPQIAAKVDSLGKQTRFATAVALTRTGQDVKAAEIEEMKKVFKGPTPFTLNSLFLKPATKDTLTAIVYVKDTNRPSHYLLPEIEGGPRYQKRFEELLKQRGMLGADERTVPGSGAKLDSFGNMSRALIIQILSQLQAFNLAGANQNATNSARSKSKRSSVQYFYARKGESRVGGGSFKRGEKIQHLATGIYARSSKGVVPVLIFVKHAQYKQRFRFFDVAQRVIDTRFPIRFSEAYAEALRTARWSS